MDFLDRSFKFQNQKTFFSREFNFANLKKSNFSRDFNFANLENSNFSREFNFANFRQIRETREIFFPRKFLPLRYENESKVSDMQD